MTSPIRWGVLGCARIARLHLVPAITRTQNAVLQAVASRNADRLAEFSGLFGQFSAYNSYDELIEDAEVDAVYIPLPNALHCEWAVRAMQAGKHVLCEKPLALNSHQATRMVETARACGVQLMEALMYRYTDRTRQTLQILASGRLGKIRSINASFRFLLDRVATIKEDPALGGGALYDVGCYPLDLIGLVTGSEPVSCVVEYQREHGVDVNLSALLRYDDGLIASLHCGFNAFGRMHTEIIGTDGMLESSDTYLDDAGELILRTKAGSERIAVAASDRYAAEIADFSRAIQQQRQPYISLEQSLRTMRVMDRLIAQCPPPG
jgi:xylose dehydrogenase (NAD/NADP)